MKLKELAGNKEQLQGFEKTVTVQWRQTWKVSDLILGRKDGLESLSRTHSIVAYYPPFLDIPRNRSKFLQLSTLILVY
jgi:hypothetical protein